MKQFLFCILTVTFCAVKSYSQQDTTVIQTFTFEAQNNPATAYESPGRRWFQFPASNNGISYQKILMYHTLKCFSDGTAGNLGYPCGEWDYLTYNNLFEHTGNLDSTLYNHPHFLLGNQNFASSGIRSTPAYNIQQIEQQIPTTTPAGNNTFISIGNGSATINALESQQLKKFQWIYTANDLLAAGLSAGNIWQLTLPDNAQFGTVHQLKIRYRETTASSLTNFINQPMATLYEGDYTFQAGGDHVIAFAQPLIWGGIENILIEFSYEPSPNLGTVFTSTPSLNSCISATGNNKFIRFDGNDEIRLFANAFSNVSNEVTVSFWLRGNEAFQPENGTCFEGRSQENFRVLNTHLPWSNSRVYWDAGQTGGGYDRIDNLANPSTYETNWNYWTFTKNNGTGEMKIYLNGQLWHSGSNLTKSMAGIVQFSIGAACTWSNYYRGDMDEFTLFNKALTEGEILSLMNVGPQESDASYSNLQFYYTFNNDTDMLAIDESPNGYHGQILGNPEHIAHDLFYSNIVAEISTPDVVFGQGDFNITLTPVIYDQYIYDAPVSLATYSINNHAPALAALSSVYLPRTGYTFNPQGLAIDSTAFEPEYTLNNDTLFYYGFPYEVINRYELGRFITPYGIQLDMGEGWTWVFDVTDFAPFLRDSVELEAGNWQELLDLKFVFIEGTPAREVSRVQNVWQGNWGLGGFNAAIQPKTYTLLPNESSAKLRTTLTGHGFGTGNNCGEFCYNTHSLKVNGSEQFSWEIMQECDENPLYPQGGTWIYARAAWCPGAPGRTEEFELTPFLNNNQVNIEYEITDDPYGNYVTETQLITYGPNNHSVDAEIDQVLAPSNWLIHSRFNPMCDNPKIIIRNKGTNPLTQCTIKYGVAGESQESFEWTGNLGFMESEVVELTALNSNLWYNSQSNVGTFLFDLELASDENMSNNHAASAFSRPPVYSYLPNTDNNKMIVIFRTNAAYWENSYTLYDINDNIIFTRNFSAGNTTYRDTLELNAGCYRFHIQDNGGDGLSFFANSDGNGYCNLDRVAGAYFKQFENDFGQSIDQYFYWNTNLVSTEELPSVEASMTLVPNPSTDGVRCFAAGFDKTVEWSLFNSSGQLVRSGKEVRINPYDPIVITRGSLNSGLYFIRVNDQLRSRTEKLIFE
jgi:Concanavalin A-like lectin/glucanases superfamily/Peptide-N-glycosidase F, C terminal